jgi:transcriptional accessory protein Tex/SPT6
MRKNHKKLQDIKDPRELQNIKNNLEELVKLSEQLNEMDERIEELTKRYSQFAGDIIKLRRLTEMIPLLKKGSPFLNFKKIDRFNAICFPFGEEIKGENVLAREIYQSKLLADNKKVIKWKESLSDTDKLLLELDE